MSDGVEAPEEHAAGELVVPAGVGLFAGSPNGARRSVGIVVSRFNGDITSRLLEGAIEALEEAGVARWSRRGLEAVRACPVGGGRA